MNEAVLPRGPFEEEKPCVPTPEQELAEAVTYLASCRNAVGALHEFVVASEKALADTDLGKRLALLQDRLEDTRNRTEEATIFVRSLALDIHAETTERRAHGAVLVKHYEVPIIKDEEALFEHVRIHLRQCVRLDKREVNRVAKIIPLPGVEIQEEYRATIKRDLSQWLPEETE